MAGVRIHSVVLYMVAEVPNVSVVVCENCVVLGSSLFYCVAS